MDGQNGIHNWAEKRIFTTGEAADICKVSQQTIIRCFDSGRLSGFRVPGSKFRRIPRSELIRFMKANEIPTDILEGSTKRVLVVDDDPAILEMFTDLLSREPGLDVRTCSTGYDAGMLTEAFKPHLLILDYMLPDVNGDLVCRRLRERDENKSTKVLFISGVVQQEEVQRLMAAGADGFIHKPFDIDALMDTILKLLEIEV
ncbi:MAG: response regulator [Phycisphaerales bacterium]|nr:response regulator [Phycisphaerales bacterium]